MDRSRRRLSQLCAGLVLYGVSDALLVESALGLSPWDVLHQGLSRSVGLSIGAWVVIVGALVLLLWLPLRQRPGIGTVSNVVVIGVVLDLSLVVLPTPDRLPAAAARGGPQTGPERAPAAARLGAVRRRVTVCCRGRADPRAGRASGKVSRHDTRLP